MAMENSKILACCIFFNELTIFEKITYKSKRNIIQLTTLNTNRLRLFGSPRDAFDVYNLNIWSIIVSTIQN